MNHCKKIAVVLVVGVSMLDAVTHPLRVEKPERLTRLFWDTTDKISTESFNNVLILMNKALELKLENELFAATLRQLSKELNRITTNLESQTIFKQRIDALIQALSVRSQKELTDLAVLRLILESLGMDSVQKTL